MKFTRKCKVCGSEFNIYDNDYVLFKGGFVEVECYAKYKENKGTPIVVINDEIERLLVLSKEDKDKRFEKYEEDNRKKLEAKKRELNRKNNLDLLIKYITEVYQIKVIPKNFYTKLAQINNGTFTRMTSGIPYEDLLDMFRRKQSYLDKVNSNNKIKGKEIDGINRLNYDIAILINKYDDYLSWKNKEKVIAAQTNKNISDEKEEVYIDYSKFNKQRQENEIDISDILEDIF